MLFAVCLSSIPFLKLNRPVSVSKSGMEQFAWLPTHLLIKAKLAAVETEVVFLLCHERSLVRTCVGKSLTPALGPYSMFPGGSGWAGRRLATRSHREKPVESDPAW